MKTKSLVKAVVLSLILLITTGAATTTSPNASAKNSSVVIKTYLRADLSLKSVFSPNFLPTANTRSAVGFIIKTCRCTCGEQQCFTDADCGPGGVCDYFVTPLCPG